MKITFLLPAFWLLFTLHGPVLAATGSEQPVECTIALRIISSPEYVSAHGGEIPDGDQMDSGSRTRFVTDLFKDSLSKAKDREQFCSNTIRDNLSYTGSDHFPKPCAAFMPLLKKSFEDKVSYKKDLQNTVEQRMNESLLDMLVLNETAPDQLARRCEVGIEVMQTDLHDRHLKEKFPLPAACEVLFADMEKTLLLPTELDTLRRQRVIFAVENKNTPEKLDAICNEISR